MFQGEILAFYCTFISLGDIYLPVLKSLVYMYEKWQMNRLWLTLIYLYRWYIPDLIQLLRKTKLELLFRIFISYYLPCNENVGF